MDQRRLRIELPGLHAKNDAAVFGELDRIPDEVEKNLLDSLSVRQDPVDPQPAEVDRQADSLRFGVRSEESRHRSSEGIQGSRSLAKDQLAGFYLRVVEDIVEDVHQGRS